MYSSFSLCLDDYNDEDDHVAGWNGWIDLKWNVGGVVALYSAFRLQTHHSRQKKGNFCFPIDASLAFQRRRVKIGKK